MTRWTIVATAQGAAGEDRRREALAGLCEAYWYPLYAYLRRSGEAAADAEDLTQGFFSHLLSGDRLQLLSGEKGRLRAYLLRAIKNYVQDDRSKAQTQKRGGKVRQFSWDQLRAEERYDLEPGHGQDPEHHYERRWAAELLERAMTRVKEDYHGNGRGELFEVLQDVLPEKNGGMNREELAERLGTSVSAATVALFRIRQRFRRALELEIAETVVSPEEVEEEIGYLFQLFDHQS